MAKPNAEPSRLLAKSSATPESPRSEETLQGHTAQVLAAARVLLSARGAASLAAARLPAAWESRLERIVRLGAFVHDLGKASDQFQEVVRHRRQKPQLVRHEALSLWLCWPGQPLHPWLRPAVESDEDYLLALLAVAGHHRKYPRAAVAPRGVEAGTFLTVLTGHADFAALLSAGARWLDLQREVPELRHLEVTRDIIMEFQHRAEETAFDAVRPETDEAQLLSLCKALVLDADVAGSALPRGGETHHWIGAALRQRASRDQLEQLVEHRLKGQPPRPFQQAVQASTAPVTLVRAGCGTGKTAAAYLWCAKQHAGRQLWVTYPTTGTATEGFRDYVREADVIGRLEHGRAEVDYDIFSLDEDKGAGKTGEEVQRDVDRLEALRHWGAEVVTCTVDTVLGLVQNQRKGLYAWPGLCDAALVFDEVHAYDDALFGALLRFLAALPGVPALLMTASLPAHRLAALQALVERVHGRPLADIMGPPDLETLPRYRRLVVEKDAVWPAVRTCLDGGGKVLWVSNTVKRCRALADEAPAGIQPLVYHSRFRYIDRVERHRAVIDAFGRPGPALALTTQVAEMSLDLSADLLVTDLASIPALIQRLGRLNRRSTPKNPMEPKPFVVLSPDGAKPYTEAELERAQEWLAHLKLEPIAQRDLVNAWTEAEMAPPAPGPSAWLDDGFVTEPQPLRESSPGITVILEEDARAVRREEKCAVAFALPMTPPPGPWANAWRQWCKVGCYPVAPAETISYDPLRGAEWRK
jgi:CRISPR-associated endonuclease/helicase Cas3